jgi:hypothetical protein
MKLTLLMTQFISIFALKLCRNCKFYTKAKCALFPIVDETKYLDWITARNDVFCGEEARYYEPYDKNKPLELPDDYDFETYIQLL